MTTVTVNRPTETDPTEPVVRPPHRRRRLTLVVLVVVAVLLGTAGWLVYGSSAFSTDEVSVHGERQVTDGQVAEVAAVPLGLPLARQDVDGIAQRATTLPAVKSATVSRQWPHTILVTVVERQPVLGVRQPGGYLVVDEDGVAYENRESLPRGAVVADVNPDATEILTHLGTVAAALPSSLRSKVASVQATSVDDIVVKLESGVVVQWGTSADSPLKSEIVLALLKEKPKISIDVTSPHNPAIR